MAKKTFDFSGWATRSNIRCSDGRTILPGAFKGSCGKTVPLVWNHQHNEPANVLGHADLVDVNGDVFTYCTFNDTENGELSKILVKHGDIVALSIYANHLTEHSKNVAHGEICEVSLVHKGANPGAFIEDVLIHGDSAGEEAIIYNGEPIELFHADKDDGDDKGGEPKDKKDDGKTVKDVINSMTEEQRNVCYAMVGAALEDAQKKNTPDDGDKEGGKDDMKHNVFDQDSPRSEGVICHADQEEILNLAKNAQVATFQNALGIYMEDNALQHADAAAGGFVQDGEGNVSYLFPEYKDVRPGAPELITSDQGWIGTVLNKVHKSPISRVRTRQVDIRNISSLRAKGYGKGKQKALAGNFKLAMRTTDPQTIYVKNALHKDDITDITDFDYVQYLYNIDRMMLNEELATALMLGDGRDDGDADKISEEHIRPIWTDDDLYTIHTDVDIAGAKAALQGSNTTANFGENYIYAEAIIQSLLYARENFKGSGTPDLFCTPHLLNVMLLARDLNGRRIYDSKKELAAALNVGEIYTAEQFENRTRQVTVTEGGSQVIKTKKLLGIVANLNDYSLGSTKGGKVSHFTQFDIDFNQQKSLIETRVSGALTRVYSAIALEEDVTA